MQLSLFEEIDHKKIGIEYVVKSIVLCDSIRGSLKKAIENKDRNELVKLFQESINTYGFGEPHGYGWSRGILRDSQNEMTYKITARELADTALKISERLTP